MLENIRRIGLFMIAAQTFIQFAARKQYEKYIKIISSVIVLLMFVSPFASSQENLLEQWEEQMEGMMKELESSTTMNRKTIPDTDYGTTERVVQQLEEKIKTKLNYEMQEEEYQITDVIIEWENVMSERTEQKQELTVKGIIVTLQQVDQYEESRAEEAVAAPVVIEEIQIGTDIKQGQDGQSGGAGMEYNEGPEKRTREYALYFAEILGIDADKVEVVYRG